MRILFVESGLHGGGSWKSLREFLEEIEGKDYDVRVVAFNATPEADRMQAMRVPVYIIRDPVYTRASPLSRPLDFLARRLETIAPWSLLTFVQIVHARTIRKIITIIKEHRVDLVHLNDQVDRDLFGVIAADRAEVPCVSHLRSMRNRGFDQRRARFVNRVVSRFIANSSACKDHWVAAGVEEAKMTVIPNAIPLVGPGAIDLHEIWDLPKTKRIIVCVAVFTSGKGQEFLLEGFRVLREKRDDVELLFVGEGDLRPRVKARAEQLGLGNVVHMTGHDPRASMIMADADLVAVPSRTEAFGRVAVEAMAVGTPVVATRVGGLSEIVREGQNGLLVDYGDASGLASAMDRMLSDEALRSKVISNGRRIVEENYSMNRYKMALEEVYCEVARDD